MACRIVQNMDAYCRYLGTKIIVITAGEARVESVGNLPGTKTTKKGVKFASSVADACRGGRGNLPVVLASTPRFEEKSCALSLYIILPFHATGYNKIYYYILYYYYSAKSCYRFGTNSN